MACRRPRGPGRVAPQRRPASWLAPPGADRAGSADPAAAPAGPVADLGRRHPGGAPPRPAGRGAAAGAAPAGNGPAIGASECSTSTSTCSGKMRNATWMHPVGPGRVEQRPEHRLADLPGALLGQRRLGQAAADEVPDIRDGRRPGGENLGKHNDRDDLDRVPPGPLRGSATGLSLRQIPVQPDWAQARVRATTSNRNPHRVSKSLAAPAYPVISAWTHAVSCIQRADSCVLQTVRCVLKPLRRRSSMASSAHHQGQGA